MSARCGPAIMEANALGGSSAHYIYLLPNHTHTLYLDPDGNGHDTDGGASTDDLDITANIVIVGNFATIQRTGTCTIDNSVATGEFRIFEVKSGGKLTLRDVTVRDGCADGEVENGGGIAVNGGGELTVQNSTLANHRASNRGGGIYSDGTVTIENSTIAGNHADDGGGVVNGLGKTMTIRNSTFSGNTAVSRGGGIYNYGTLTVINSTFSGNSASGGGGIMNDLGTTKLSFVTVAENSGGGIRVYGGSTLQIRHSIVAKNTGSNCSITIGGTFTPFGDNFADGNTCSGFASLTPSALGPLAGNGGATQTHALYPGSQAINAASDCQDLNGNTVSTDQRSVLRPQPSGGNCDAGAYERDDNTPPGVSLTSPAPDPTNASPIPVTVTFSEAVTGFTAADIAVSNGAVSNFAGSGAVYTFDLIPAGDGVVTADIAAGVAVDAAGNGNTAAAPFSRTYDTTAPGVVSITRVDPNPTSAAGVAFTVTFSEAVIGVDAGDFGLTATGSIGGASVTGVSGAGSVYTVNVSTGTGSGTLRLDIPGTATITDPAGNGLSGLPYTGGQAYDVDKTAPAASSTLFLPVVLR